MNTNFSTRKIASIGLLLALATILSFINILPIFPFGGSITPLSMFFVIIIGYYYGPKVGLVSAFIYGLLQLLIKPYVVSIPQGIIDYVFAFTSLGLGAFIYRKKGKHSLEIVCTISVLFRCFFAVLSGVVFFAQYTPDGWPVILYSIIYNAGYLIPELIITLAVLQIKGFKNLLDNLFINQ